MQNIPTTPFLPYLLSKSHPSPETPWKESSRILKQTDTLYQFVFRYFNAHKPTNRSIGKVEVVADTKQTSSFEAWIRQSEMASFDDPLSPPWTQEKGSESQFLANDHWEKGAAEFSPFSLTTKEKIIQTKVLPLWQGATPESASYISQNGFNPTQSPLGWGISFKSQANKALTNPTQKTLLLAWVAMRRPYPQTQTVATPKRGYTAHYIPKSNALLVFKQTQALLQVKVELTVDLIKSPSTQPTIATLLQTLETLLKKEAVKKDGTLMKALKEKQTKLQRKTKTAKLSSSEKRLFERLGRLFNSKGRLQSKVRNKLVPSSSRSSSSSSSAPRLPKEALGKAIWQKHFNHIQGTQAPLPSNIEAILNAPTPFKVEGYSGKVRDTHILVWIPEVVDGVDVSLDGLNTLFKYRSYSDAVKKEIGGQKLGKATWVLISKNVLEGSRSKSYDQQKKIMSAYASQGYTLPKALEVTAALLIHEKETKKRLLTDDPWTYTRCQESVNNNQWPVAIGGFAAGGLSVRYYSWIDNQRSGVVGARKL
ncbi:hypothetical protein [Candidatus Neptunochlamydia vexilliferae]|nr:hypothetical protein [Candidatus Neptunochlamydia vexilliferae]